MPTLLQASISRVPAGAATFLPSTVMLMSAILECGAGALPRAALSTNLELRQNWLRYAVGLKWTRFSIQMIFEFFPEFLHDGNGRQRRRIAQRAKRAAQHVLRQILNVVDIFFHSGAGVEAGERLFQPVRAFAAGNAPATTLVL